MPRISSPWGNIFCKFGKEAALVIYAPGVLGAIETIGAVISIFD